MARKLAAIILIGVLLGSCFACSKRKHQEDRAEELQAEVAQEEVKEEEVPLPEKRQLEGHIVDITSFLDRELNPMFFPQEYLGIPGGKATIAPMTVSLRSVGYKTLAPVI